VVFLKFLPHPNPLLLGEGALEHTDMPHIKNVDKARDLRKNQTEAESLLWYHIRNKRFQGFKFRRQLPIGNYIVDFVCESVKVIIELDGSQHMDTELYDNKRTQYLSSLGYKVLRYWNNELLSQTDSVLESIRLNLLKRAN